MPEISVVIPTYNAARYVGAAVDSVLAQTFTDLEVLVVDDGSEDNTREVLAPYGQPVRYLYQENAGVSAARNLGIAKSRGRYVAFLDADDTWLPGKLELQRSALTCMPGVGACYSAHIVADEDLSPLGVQRSPRRAGALEDLLFRGNVVGTPSTVIVERELLERVGGFDPAFSQCADWDMWVRVARHTEFAYIGEPLVTYRQHANNMSRNIRLLEDDSLRVIRKGLEHPETPAVLRRRARQAFANQWMVVAGSYFGVGDYSNFARCAVRALLQDPRRVTRLLGYPIRRLHRVGQVAQPSVAPKL